MKIRFTKKIYFTFDDGPVPGMTTWVLDTLKGYNAKASFFCVGDNVRKYPDVYDLILSGGHQVGNHTYSHLNGYKSGIRKYVLDVVKAEKNLKYALPRLLDFYSKRGYEFVPLPG